MREHTSVALRIYRAARERSMPAFKDEAIRLLQSALRFESANWGTGYLRHDGHALCVAPIACRSVNVDPDALAHWASINRADKVIALVQKWPGTSFNLHAADVFCKKEDAVMRDYVQRYGRQNYLCTALTGESPALFEWFSAYRRDPNDQFSENERSLCEALLQHLCEATLLNRLLSDPAGTPVAPTDHACTRAPARHEALVATNGAILSAESGFLMQCRREWSQFTGVQIPKQLMAQLVESGPGIYRGRAGAFSARRIAEYLLIRVTARTSSDILSPRRMDVAAQFARGISAKSIARNLGVSPSTVRNHLAHSYRALKVNSREELRRTLEQKGVF